MRGTSTTLRPLARACTQFAQPVHRKMIQIHLPKSNWRHSGTPSVRHQPKRNIENCWRILVCNRKNNLEVTGHVQPVQKQSVLPSDVCKHKEVKCPTLSKFCLTSERSGRNRRRFCQTLANSASNLERCLDCIIRSSRQFDGPWPRHRYLDDVELCNNFA